MRGSLGDEYVTSLRETYEGRVVGGADLVCFWHEKAREQIERRLTRRAGLLATNSIRGGRNRSVLHRIKETGDIFMAWSDQPWVVEGAAVRVSIVGQDDGSESDRTLDGEPVEVIHPDLTGSTGGTGGGIDLTIAVRLLENQGVCFYSDVKAGPFDIPGQLARRWLTEPANPNGRRNVEVTRPWINAIDVTRRPRDMFIVDFGSVMPESEAAGYEFPFEYVKANVLPVREATRRRAYRENWWRHAEPVAGMRQAIDGLDRFLVTPSVSKHRLFVWAYPPTLPDHAVITIARNDDYTFGVLHSRPHERWALRMGTSLEDRPRYTPTSTFQTYPFPWPLNTSHHALTGEQAWHRDAIASAACALNEARERWLNPPELVSEEPDVVPELPPRLVPVDEAAAIELHKRTLTNLYNARPAWLDNLHADLDRAVFAAYAWPEPPEELPEEEVLGRLLALNQDRSR